MILDRKNNVSVLREFLGGYYPTNFKDQNFLILFMFITLFLFLLVAASTKANYPIEDHQYSSLQKSLPPDMLNNVYEFLNFHDSFKLHTLLKNDDQDINPLSIPRLKSRLNPFTNHAVTDGKEALELIKKSPDHLRRKLLLAYLHNPSLSKANARNMMDMAIETGVIDIVEAFAHYYHLPFDRCLENLSYFMGQQNRDLIQNFCKDPRVLINAEKAKKQLAIGAFDSDNVRAFKWVLKWIKFDPSFNYNWFFAIAVMTGKLGLARAIYDNPRILQILDPDMVDAYNQLLLNERRPALWPSNFFGEVQPQFSGKTIVLTILFLLYLLLV